MSATGFEPTTTAHKRTINHLAKLAKSLSCVVRTYLYGALDCVLLSCYLRVLKWIHTLWLVEWQGTPCLKQARYMEATIECGFTLKRVRDMIITYSQMHRTDNFSQHSLIIWPVWLNGWVLAYEVIGCGFESLCNHLIILWGLRFSWAILFFSWTRAILAKFVDRLSDKIDNRIMIVKNLTSVRWWIMDLVINVIF